MASYSFLTAETSNYEPGPLTLFILHHIDTGVVDFSGALWRRHKCKNQPSFSKHHILTGGSHPDWQADWQTDVRSARRNQKDIWSAGLVHAHRRVPPVYPSCCLACFFLTRINVKLSLDIRTLRSSPCAPHPPPPLFSLSLGSYLWASLLILHYGENQPHNSKTIRLKRRRSRASAHTQNSNTFH